MSKYLEYRGYYGKYEYNAECDFWTGRIAYMEENIIFEAKDRVSLNKSFHDAVDNYIAQKEKIREV